MRLVAVLALLLAPAFAEARCVCQCVDGKFQPLCDSPQSRPVSCKVNDYARCPAVPKNSVAPPLPPGPVPAGAKRCRMAQVYVPLQTRYEWRRVCE
jgi:hypothetical protein